MSDVIYVENDNGLNVSINEMETEINPEGYIFVRNGEKEIEAYVQDIVKPDLALYSQNKQNDIENTLNSQVDAARVQLNNFTNSECQTYISQTCQDKKMKLRNLLSSLKMPMLPLLRKKIWKLKILLLRPMRLQNLQQALKMRQQARQPHLQIIPIILKFGPREVIPKFKLWVVLILPKGGRILLMILCWCTKQVMKQLPVIRLLRVILYLAVYYSKVKPVGLIRGFFIKTQAEICILD